MAILSSSPGRRHQHNKHREQFQASRQHVEHQHKFGKRAENREVAAGPDSVQAGADVIECGGYRRKISRKVKVVHTDEQRGDQKHQKVNDKEYVGRAQDLVADDMSVHAHFAHLPRVNREREFLFDRLAQKDDAGYFHSAAGAAGAGAQKHQENQNTFGEFRPQIKVCRRKSRGRDDGADLKERVAQCFLKRRVKVSDIEGYDAHGA